jgi:hypothetical protein
MKKDIGILGIQQDLLVLQKILDIFYLSFITFFFHAAYRVAGKQASFLPLKSVRTVRVGCGNLKSKIKVIQQETKARDPLRVSKGGSKKNEKE